MQRADLERLLVGKRSEKIERYGHLAAALADLYRLGLTVRQLEALLPVSRQWIRNRLKENGVTFRAAHGRPLDERQVSPDSVIRVLRRHGIDLKDLPGRAERPRSKAHGARR